MSRFSLAQGEVMLAVLEVLVLGGVVGVVDGASISVGRSAISPPTRLMTTIAVSEKDLALSISSWV